MTSIVSLIGDYQVGRTSIMAAYEGYDLSYEYIPTCWDTITLALDVEKNNSVINVAVIFRDVRLQVFDEALFKLCLSDSTCIIACYSVVSLQSAQNLKDRWLEYVDKAAGKVPILFCGTKLDLKKSNPGSYVPLTTVREMFKDIEDSYFMECSAQDEMFRTGETEGTISLLFEKAAIMGLPVEPAEKKSSNCTLL